MYIIHIYINVTLILYLCYTNFMLYIYNYYIPIKIWHLPLACWIARMVIPESHTQGGRKITLKLLFGSFHVNLKWFLPQCSRNPVGDGSKPMKFSHTGGIHIHWLVVYLPLWKIWIRQLGWLFPVWWESHNPVMFHQPVIKWLVSYITMERSTIFNQS